MGGIASQITSLTIVYSALYSDTDQKKTSKLPVTGLCAGNSPGTGEFPAQMASNAENVSIWWRHHVMVLTKISVDIEARPSDPILVYYFSAIDSCWEMVMNQPIMAWNVILGDKKTLKTCMLTFLNYI